MARERLRRVRDLLPGAARRAGMDDHAVEAGRVFRRWRDVVGPHIGDHAEPSSLREGVLRVRADSPAWATEVGYLAEEIRVRVNETTGVDLVREVRVWTGPPSGIGVRAAGEASGAASEGRTSPAAEDPIEGLARAHRAWLRRRARAVENPRKPW